MAEGWEVLATVENEEEARVMCGYLESSGVPCELDSSHSHEFPVTVGSLAVVRLQVPVERLAEAQRLLAERENGPDAAADDTLYGEEEPPPA